jgi:hypothetical protein
VCKVQVDAQESLYITRPRNEGKNSFSGTCMANHRKWLLLVQWTTRSMCDLVKTVEIDNPNNSSGEKLGASVTLSIEHQIHAEQIECPMVNGSRSSASARPDAG